MLRKGPIPRVVYGLLQYVLGAFLVAAPFLFSYASGAAKATSIVAGLVVLTLAATSDSPTGLSKVVPLAASLVFDLALVALFVAAPFLFGFSDESSPTAVFIVAGVALLLLTIATRFKPSDDGGDGDRGRRGRRRERSTRTTEVAGTVEPPEFEVPAERPADGAGTPPPRA
jgi:fatty acid desaturase